MHLYCMVLNGFLVVITQCTNLVLPQVFAANNIVKAVTFVTFQGSHNFSCQYTYYKILAYLIITVKVSYLKCYEPLYLSNIVWREDPFSSVMLIIITAVVLLLELMHAMNSRWSANAIINFITYSKCCIQNFNIDCIVWGTIRIMFHDTTVAVVSIFQYYIASQQLFSLYRTRSHLFYRWKDTCISPAMGIHSNL